MRENQSIPKQIKAILGLFVFLGLLTMPVAYAAEIADTIPAGTSAFGLGDILATAYLSPIKATHGWITGFGEAY